MQCGRNFEPGAATAADHSLAGARENRHAVWDRLSQIRSNLHYGLSAFLLAALIPAFHAARLQLEWPTFVPGFLLALAIESIFMASILYSFGLPRLETLEPLRKNKRRFLLLIPLAAQFVWLLGWSKGLILAVDIAAIAEFLYRTPAHRWKRVASVLIPAVYFCLGVLVVFNYTAWIASVRFYGAYDAFLDHIDSWLLFGSTVPQLSQRAVAALPLVFFQALEIIYFGMFAQIGAGIIFSGMAFGMKRAAQVAGTILLAYYFALALFYLWPSHGPYYVCANHFSTFPRALDTYAVQKALLANAQRLWRHQGVVRAGIGYYIAFPCMHIAQPMIVLWYVRRWKRVALLLVAYDIVLVLAIVLLEWHYVIDILGGLVVALAAIWITDTSRCRGNAGGGVPMQPEGQ